MESVKMMPGVQHDYRVDFRQSVEDGPQSERRISANDIRFGASFFYSITVTKFFDNCWLTSHAMGYSINFSSEVSCVSRKSDFRAGFHSSTLPVLHN